MKTRRGRIAVSRALLYGLLAMMWTSTVAHAMSKSEQQKLESAAKKAFYSSDYEKAKEIYSTLLAESDDRIYLRNIARCYEQLKQPGPALDNFKAYLNRAGSTLSVKEREEITERIQAMERLLAAQAEEEAKKKETAPAKPADQNAQSEAATAEAAKSDPGAPPTLPAASVSLVPSAPSQEATQASPTGDIASAPPVPAPQPTTLRTIGGGLLVASGIAAIVGGIVMYAAWSSYNANKDGKCGSQASCDSARDSVDTMNLWSKLSFGVAAGAAVLGGAFYIIAPSPQAPRDVAAGMRWTY